MTFQLAGWLAAHSAVQWQCSAVQCSAVAVPSAVQWLAAPSAPRSTAAGNEGWW
jgi:hypothetical protein